MPRMSSSKLWGEVSCKVIKSCNRCTPTRLNQRRKWLQEAKLQPKVKVMIYDDKRGKESTMMCSTDTTHHGNDIGYEVSTPRTA